MLRAIKDPVSCLTHLAGAVLAVVCTVLLLVAATRDANARYIVGFAVFGTTLVLQYVASTVYHMVRASERTTRILRRIDHMMIFVLIAGTYTPVCLVPLYGAWGWTLLGLVWGIAVAGVVLKIFWLHAPRWLSTALYMGMGWLVLIALVPLVKAVSVSAFALLVAGGGFYTLGAVMYAAKWPPLPFRWFGFHELFHVFVLGGSACHALFMFRLVPA